MSCVSDVMCPNVICTFFKTLFLDKLVELVGVGSAINGPDPYSLYHDGRLRFNLFGVVENFWDKQTDIATTKLNKTLGQFSENLYMFGRA